MAAGRRFGKEAIDLIKRNLKGRFPFRLGTTSYIIPDEILPNVRYLADKIDDIELVLFESDEISNIPDEATVAELASIARDNDLTYTVHLPLDAYLGSCDEHCRTASVEKCLRIIDSTLSLNPFAFVVHFHGDRRGESPSEDISLWQAQHCRSMERLIEAVASRMFAVETLDYPFDLVEDIVEHYDLSVCLDAGHIWLCGYNLNFNIKRYVDDIRVIHLHGLENGVDHRDISSLSDSQIKSVINAAENGAPDKVMTLEIFGEHELNKSIEILQRYVI